MPYGVVSLSRESADFSTSLTWVLYFLFSGIIGLRLSSGGGWWKSLERWIVARPLLLCGIYGVIGTLSISISVELYPRRSKSKGSLTCSLMTLLMCRWIICRLFGGGPSESLVDHLPREDEYWCFLKLCKVFWRGRVVVCDSVWIFHLCRTLSIFLRMDYQVVGSPKRYQRFDQ